MRPPSRSRQARHARLLAFPYTALLAARLDALHDETHGQRRELVMDYHELRLSAPPELSDCDGSPCEHGRGQYVPGRLRFRGVRWLKHTGLDTYLEGTPLDHDTRRFTGALHWRTPDGDSLYLFGIHSDEPSSLLLSAQQCVSEERSGPIEKVDFVRAWSPPPPNPARLVPAPKRIHPRYNGDPITIRLGARRYHRRLFIGGLEEQSGRRPAVDAVLNLSEEASRWAATASPHPGDRWICKGEGKHGMSVSEIAAEAQWVVEHLRAGRRVLAHCSAGMNRSATVCCAALILLEGLPAEAALDRVREHHPWARPDPYHWLALRWLAHTCGTDISH